MICTVVVSTFSSLYYFGIVDWNDLVKMPVARKLRKLMYFCVFQATSHGESAVMWPAIADISWSVYLCWA